MSRGEAIKRPLITSSDLPHHLYRKEPRGEAETRSLITPLQPSFPITYTEDGLVGKFFPDSPTTYGEEQLVGKLASVRLFSKNVYAACLPLSSVCLPRILFGSRRGVRLRAGACTPQRCARVFTAAAALLRARDWRVRGRRRPSLKQAPSLSVGVN